MNQLNAKALTAAVEALQGDTLSAARSSALQSLLETGLPTTRVEDWKYTDLEAAVDVGNDWLAATPTTLPATELTARAEAIRTAVAAHWIVIRNGQIDPDSISALSLSGLTLEHLSTHGSLADIESPLGALNIALLTDGLKISVSADCSTDRPLGLLFVDTASETATMIQARVEIDVAANAQLPVLEYHCSEGDAAHFANQVVNLHQGDGSTVQWLRIQDRDDRHQITTRTRIRLQRDAQFRGSSFDLGGALIRNDLLVDIVGQGADARFDGLYLGDSGQHIDNHTRVDHRVGPASSSQEYRGILNGRTRCVWNGKAFVHAGADGTDANQANHNLLLSEQAEINAKPELEIYADDVKCSHGTTVGQLDEQALYYLRTRGIDAEAARQMLNEAFATSIVDQCAIPSAREFVTGRVRERLTRMQGSAN